MKANTLALALISATALPAAAQFSYTATSGTTTAAWDTSRWNNSTDGPTYDSLYAENQNVLFTTGPYVFDGMGSTVNVGNITVAPSVQVNFTTGINTGTFATNGAVRTIDVGAGGLFNLQDQAVATNAGFIKNGEGTFRLGSSGAGTFVGYTGGFTLNSGEVIALGNAALGTGGTLTLNGGALGATAPRTLGGYSGGIQIGGDIQIGFTGANSRITFTDDVAIGAATRTLTVGNGNTNAFNGVISGGSGAGLTFSRLSGKTGTFSLGGANTYTGPTTVAIGTLALGLNGTIANSSNIIVGNALSTGTVLDTTLKTGFSVGGAQTLSGIGNVNVGAGKTLSINGTHAVGNAGTNNGVGIQTVTGTTDYGSSSIFAWDLASNKSSATGIRGTDYDGLTTSENLAATSGAIFKIVFGGTTDTTGTFWDSMQTWNNIFSSQTATLASGNMLFDTIRIFQGSSDITDSFNSTEGSFTFNGSSLEFAPLAVVPEPTSALAGLLLAAGLMRRSRRVVRGPVSVS